MEQHQQVPTPLFQRWKLEPAAASTQGTSVCLTEKDAQAVDTVFPPRSSDSPLAAFSLRTGLTLAPRLPRRSLFKGGSSRPTRRALGNRHIIEPAQRRVEITPQHDRRLLSGEESKPTGSSQITTGSLGCRIAFHSDTMLSAMRGEAPLEDECDICTSHDRLVTG